MVLSSFQLHWVIKTRPLYNISGLWWEGYSLHFDTDVCVIWDLKVENSVYPRKHGCRHESDES